MPDIVDIEPLQKFMCLLTGHNGSGKSILIGSWLKKGSVYFFDFDGRMNAVANFYKQRGLKRGQLTFDTYGPKSGAGLSVYDALKKLDSFLDYCPHAAIAIDSFTATTVSAVMYSLLRRQMKGGKDVPSFSRGDLIIPDFDEYKGETVYITTLLDLARTLASKGIAVFWTAHPIETLKIEKATAPGERDNYSKQTRYSAYGNKSDSLIPIYFDEIYHLTTKFDWSTNQAARYVWTVPHGEINAKTALNLPPEIDWTQNSPDDPTFYEILMKLLSKQEIKKEEIKEEAKEEKKENDLTHLPNQSKSEEFLIKW